MFCSMCLHVQPCQCSCLVPWASYNSTGSCRRQTCSATTKPSSSKAVTMCSNSARLARKSSSRSWPLSEWRPNPSTFGGSRRLYGIGSPTLPSSTNHWHLFPFAVYQCTSYLKVPQASTAMGNRTSLWFPGRYYPQAPVLEGWISAGTGRQAAPHCRGLARVASGEAKANTAYLLLEPVLHVLHMTLSKLSILSPSSAWWSA